LQVQSLSTDQYLTHHWPIENGTMKDAFGSSDMTPRGTFYIEDRFGSQNSSLALNGGWAEVPGGVYFNTPEFTITVWIYPINVGSYARIIDFGNGKAVDNVIFSLSSGYYLKPNLAIFSGSSVAMETQTSQTFSSNHWLFFAVTFNGTNSRLYLNGTLVDESTKQPFTLSTLTRSNCYVGKSNWAQDGYSHSYLDDLRFYNKSILQEEIAEIMMYPNELSIKRENFYLLSCK